MVYQLHLPPRYVELCAQGIIDESIAAAAATSEIRDEEVVGGQEEEKTSDDLSFESFDFEKIKRKVHFNEEANRSKVIERLNKTDIWYNGKDFRSFGRNFHRDKYESTVPRKQKTSFLVGKRDVPIMEDVQTFSSGASSGRKVLVRSILIHQATCLVRGFNDPTGYSILSMSLSKKSRKQAWEAAAVNAYEVDCFRREERQKVALTTLFADYYMESIQPLLQSPLALLSKILLCTYD